MDPWVILPREKMHYKEQFESLKPINGIVTGDQAKGFLMRSQLPPAILGQIWALSDTDVDGKLDINEFSIACKLIHLKLRGFEVPQMVPTSLMQSLKTPPDASLTNGGFVPQPQSNLNNLVNLGGPALPQQPGRPAPPPMASRQFRESSAASGTHATTNISSKPPARPAPPFMGNLANANTAPSVGTAPQRPAPPVNIGAGFNATTGILPRPKPAPPSFPNSPVTGASMVPTVQSMTGVAPMSAAPIVPMAGGAPVAPMNTTPAPIQAFGMQGTMPTMIPTMLSSTGMSSIPSAPVIAGVGTSMSTISSTVPTVAGIGTTAPAGSSIPTIPGPVSVPTGIISPPVSTNTPLSTTARPPSIDRVGSIDSQHSQQSQQSQHSVSSPIAVEWSVPHATKLKYTQLFNTWDRTRSGFLSGPQARNIMVQTQLPQATLAQIWALADMDSDGRLGCEEFVLAMHLCDLAKAGETIPMALTPDLVPPTFRRQRQGSVSSGGLPEVVDPSAGMPQSSFEDKRKENFEKGQAELDRRRKTLQEQQKREQEERERKEREEMEKQEKIRLEQERRRQAEIEKQLQRQREIEQEKEEQRKRAQEQKEAARKEMERQRQLEWDTQKSQELQAQRQKEQDALLKLKARNQSLTIELGTLNDRVKELSQKICDTRVGVSGVKTTIDGMRATRDSQQQEMTALKNRLREQNQRLLALSQEKARIEAKNKVNAAQDSAGQEAMRMAFQNKQITLKQLKDKITDLEQQIGEKQSDIENNNGQLEEIKDKMKNMVSDCRDLYKTFETKKSTIMEMRVSGTVDYSTSGWGTETAWPTEPVQQVSQEDEWPIDSGNNTSEEVPQGVVKYRALYEFVARNDEEISFQPGDIILVPPVQNKEPGWMAGEIRGHTGWFPESYVEPVEGGDDEKMFVQQDSVEKRPLEEIAEVPENVSEAGSLPGETVAAVPVVDNTGTGLTAVEDEYYIALYQYSSAEKDDLSFNEGEVISVSKKEGEWWYGCIGTRCGYFPSNYVDKCQPNINQVPQAVAASVPAAITSPSAVVEAVAPVHVSPTPEKTAEQLEDERQAAEDRAELPDFTAMASQQGRGKKPEIVQVLAPYQATSAEQLNLQRGQLIMIRKKTDSGWWEGELQARGKKRQIGWFPASYVKPLTSSSNRSTPVSHGYQDSPTDPNVERVMALYPHKPQNDDELAFEKGDVITVLSKLEDTWWKGELNGVIGIFPSNYITPMLDESPADHVISPFDPTEHKRQDYIRELIATEEAYINDMRLVHEVFEKPLLHSLVLTVDEVERIFVNWRDIIACNDNFLRTLRIRRDNSEDGIVRMIGDILCENIPRMSAYVRFCSCQITAAGYLQKLTETNAEFLAISQSCQQDPRTKGMPLSSFLIKPMQRITKYPLIIGKILEYTPKTHPDRHYLQEALAKADEFCTQVNEGVREKENCDRLEWLQIHVACNDSVLDEQLIFNSLTNSAGARKLLHFGIVHKAKSGKELVAFLTNDFLLFAHPLKSLPTGKQFSFERNENNKFKLYRKPIFLNELTMTGDNEPNANASTSHTTDTNDNQSRILSIRDSVKKPIILVTPSTNECNLWVKKINEARKQFVKSEKNLLQRQRSRQAQYNACGRILTTVLQGSNLKNTAGKCNAFCKVSMGCQEERTPVVSGTDSPLWDTSMQFQIKDLNEDTLCITVFDKSYYTPDDFLGRAEIRIIDIMRDCNDSCGPIQKRIKLREVDRGDVVLKLDLQLFGS